VNTYSEADWNLYEATVNFTGLYTQEFRGGPREYFFNDGECSCLRRFSDNRKKVAYMIAAYDKCKNCEGTGMMPIPPYELWEWK
jgi:hypothetical protein